MNLSSSAWDRLAYYGFLDMAKVAAAAHRISVEHLLLGSDPLAFCVRLPLVAAIVRHARWSEDAARGLFDPRTGQVPPAHRQPSETGLRAMMEAQPVAAARRRAEEARRQKEINAMHESAWECSERSAA